MITELLDSHSHPISRWNHRLIFFLLSALLFSAPLVRGGNRQVALAGLLLLGLALIALLAAQRTAYALGQSAVASPPSQAQIRWWGVLLWVVAVSPLWIGALQLVPIPADLWGQLPGRAPYLEALRSAGVAVPSALPLSLNPSATQAAMWAALPAGAALLAAAHLSHRQAETVLRVLLAAAAIQAVVGALQFGLGPQSWLYFGATGHHVIGTFANRNHLAEFLAMLLPAWFYFLVRHRHSSSHRRHGNDGLAIIPAGLRRPLWLALGFAFVVVILTSTSRGGSIAMAITLALSLGLFVTATRRQLTRAHVIGLVLVIGTLLLLIVGFVELDRIGRRIESDVVQSDAAVRWAYTVSTIQAGLTFWPWGSGLGTFESVFPRFQALESVGYINQAHNDYAQLFMESGLLAIAVALSVLVLVIRQGALIVRRARQHGRLGKTLALRCYAGFGIVGLLVHSWAEYNLYTPALAITVSALLGIFLRPLSVDE